MRINATRYRLLIPGLSLAGALFISTNAAHTAVASGVAGYRSTPVIMAVAPAELAPAKDPQVLRVSGQDFQARLTLVVTTPGGRTMEFKDLEIVLARESSFQVSVPIAVAGKYSLVVTNPDGGISAPFVLEARSVPKPPAPVIDRILPDNVVKRPEPQSLTVEGRNFGPGVRVTVTDPIGVEVLERVVSDVTSTSFKLSIKLEMSGPYNLVVTNATGAVSNVAVLTVK